MKVIWDVLISTIPPESRVVVWRVLVTVIVLGHIAWACNLLPGVSGFALSEDLIRFTNAVNEQTTQIEGKVDRILELQIVAEIERILRYKCMSPNDPTLDSTLNRLESDYRKLTGIPYMRPNCSFLVG